MAIPIRLLAGTNGDIQVDLNAQSIDIGVDRNISAFPTPNNLLKRYASDTNIPRITVEIDGILDDDAGIDTPTGVQRTLPSRMLFNFGSMLPAEPNSPFAPIRNLAVVSSGSNRFVSNRSVRFPKLVATRAAVKGSTTTLENLEATDNVIPDFNGRVQVNLKFSGAHSAGATGALTVASTLKVQGTTLSISDDPDRLGAAALLNIGDRVTKSDGTLLGLVSALTSTTITFTSALPNAISANDEVYVTPKCFTDRAEFIGYVDTFTYNASDDNYDVALTATSLIDVVPGTNITINQSENDVVGRLHERSIKLVPMYWLEDRTRNPKGGFALSDRDFPSGRNIGIRLRFNANKTPPLLGGSDQPSVLHTATRVSRGVSFAPKDAMHYDAVIDVPIGGLTDTVNTNPAVLMAQIVQDALTNAAVTSANISNVILAPGNDKTLTDVFTVTRQGAMVLIEQKYQPDSPIEHPPSMDLSLQADFSPQVLMSSTQFDSAAKKSAGDKAQDLIGLVSNAGRHSDLFRGVQIPYDSLITSSGVTGVARNFFLTFGNVPASEKGSLANERSASLPMQGLLLDDVVGGNKADEGGREGGLLSRFADKMGDFGDDLQSLTGFLVDNVQSLWVTVDRSISRGNDGGIRIIPEKVHVRYDAGKNYYTFHMVLVATDFVLGV
tara:strand:+ start:715 stop:2715 length:2001 start_codon:yes stop_codon:yes gene_type:complete